jgi:uncharacterized protein (DUF885 family)
MLLKLGARFRAGLSALLAKLGSVSVNSISSLNFFWLISSRMWFVLSSGRKTDARFFEASADAIRARLARHVTNIEPHLDRYFARKPRAPYDVQRLAPALEGAMTFGYYQRPTPDDPTGHYFFNGSKTTERNLLFAAALMAHELVPGHHFQIARQEENDALHPLRRETYDTAFVEGWGEYAAALGSEMGIYGDPYDRAGRLMMDSSPIAFHALDRAVVTDGNNRGNPVEFIRDASGAVRWIRSVGRIARKE